MSFFFKCLGVFVSLTILLLVVDRLVLQSSLPFAGSFLFSTFTSLLLTIFYGWIDDVYIQHRQPEREE